MMSFRHIKSRIRSIENIAKITRAMEMVSSAKLTRTQAMLNAAAPYSQRLHKMFVKLTSGTEVPRHVFFRAARPGPVGVCLISSDSGLCSSFNQNLLRRAETFISGYPSGTVRVVPVGKKGFHYCRKRGWPVARAFLGAQGRYSEDFTSSLVEALSGMFAAQEVQEMHLVYTRFDPGLRHKPVVEKLFPLAVPEAAARRDILLEPDFGQIFETLAPQYVFNKIKLTLLESFVAEHSARAVAMKTATDNAKDLLEALILQRNKIRQGAITKEVLEIISAVEALKG